jgi:hypothetical protein
MGRKGEMEGSVGAVGTCGDKSFLRWRHAPPDHLGAAVGSIGVAKIGS